MYGLVDLNPTEGTLRTNDRFSRGQPNNLFLPQSRTDTNLHSYFLSAIRLWKRILQEASSADNLTRDSLCPPPVQLPQRFADFSLSKVQTIRHNLDSQAQSMCFGESEEQSVACSLSSFRPVSEDDVRKIILKS